MRLPVPCSNRVRVGAEAELAPGCNRAAVLTSCCCGKTSKDRHFTRVHRGLTCRGLLECWFDRKSISPQVRQRVFCGRERTAKWPTQNIFCAVWRCATDLAARRTGEQANGAKRFTAQHRLSLLRYFILTWNPQRSTENGSSIGTARNACKVSKGLVNRDRGPAAQR